MKKGLTSMMCASALLGATSFAFAGAYGEAEQPEEMPAPAPAPAAAYVEPESAARLMREFAGFQTDAETVRGFYGEIGALYTDQDEFDADAISSFLRLAYGQEMWEAGLQLPYEWYDVDNGPSDNGVGDLGAWIKVLPVRTDTVTFGGGLKTTSPTGDHDIVSHNDFGLQPFLTGAYNCSSTVSLRGTVGYNVITASTNDFDTIDYNAAVLGAVSDMVVVRAELVGQHYIDGFGDEDPVSIQPGVDITVPLSGVDLIVRPTGLVGVNDSPNWGLGLSIALAQSAS